MSQRLIYLPILFFIAVLAWTNGESVDEPLLLSPSGREIPLSHVNRVIKASSLLETQERIYEIDEELKMLSSFGSVDLKKETVKSQELADEPPTIILNGKESKKVPQKAYIRPGLKYSVVHMKDQTIIAVFGRNLGLIPLHMRDYPGVFVNTAKKNGGGIHNLTGDEIGASEDDSNSLNMDGIVFNDGKKERGAKASKQEKNNQEKFVVHQNKFNTCRLGNVIKQLEIAAASDNSLCDNYYNNPEYLQAGVQAAIQWANQPYRRQTCVYLKLIRLEINCANPKDPYAFLYNVVDPVDTIVEFAKYWNRNRQKVRRDVAYFFPGYYDTTTTSGVAVTGMACRKELAYGWVEGLEPIVIAHEIGHNLNCPHSTDGGIMKPSWGGIFDVLLFSPSSLRKIYAFMDFPKNSSCIQPMPFKRGNCAQTFTMMSTFICEKNNIGNVFFTSDKSARVNVILEQEFDYFKVTFQAANGVKIFSLATALRMIQIGFDTDLGPTKSYANGVSKVIIKVPTSQVKFPFSSRECCGSRLGVLFRIKWCKRNNCATFFTGFWEDVACGKCDQGKRLLPQTATRRCAQCQG